MYGQYNCIYVLFCQGVFFSFFLQELNKHLIVLISGLEPHVNACDVMAGDSHTIVKNMYLSVWNASLVAETALERLTLQKYSLVFQLSTGAPIFKVCDQALKVLCKYEHDNKSLGNSHDFCSAVITSLTRMLKKNSSFDGETVLSIVPLVMQYSKALTISGKCSEFSRTTRPLVSLLEGGCDQKTVLALKVGLKLTETGMALKMGKCQEDMLAKFIESCNMVPNGTLPDNIMLTSLLCMMSFFEVSDQKDITVRLLLYSCYLLCARKRLFRKYIVFSRVCDFVLFFFIYLFIYFFLCYHDNS